jgi:hypothetical protein
MMREHIVDLQVSSPPQGQQPPRPQTGQQVAAPSSIGEFILDDLKLFVCPVTAVVNEFRRQVKR